MPADCFILGTQNWVDVTFFLAIPTYATIWYGSCLHGCATGLPSGHRHKFDNVHVTKFAIHHSIGANYLT